MASPVERVRERATQRGVHEGSSLRDFRMLMNSFVADKDWDASDYETVTEALPWLTPEWVKTHG